MNKDFKSILVLGIIAIIISWIGLFQFRDVKFRNTTDIDKNKKEQQEQLLNEYKELVDVYIPTITDQIQENDLPKTWTINIIMPTFLENKWFQKISDKLKENEIFISFDMIDSYSQYESEIKSNLQNYDIALVPTNRLWWIDTETISLWENIKPYFIDIFNKELNSTSNSLIPFSIDPAITEYKIWISEQSNRESLFSYSITRKSQKKYSMPILWWFDVTTIKLIESKGIPFENYIEILYLQLKQIKNSNNNSELSNMLNTNNIALKEKYTLQNLKTITNLIKSQNESCNIYPGLCTLRYGYTDIKFWFLTDLDILEKYFPGENKIYIWNFTNSKNSYPVKWRVFIVPKWNENTNLTNKFFSEYISESVDWNSNFWNNTLSAISNIYENQKAENKFKNILQNENNFYIFTGGINLQDQIINDGRTIEMLKWKYNVKSYLSNFQY